MHAQNHSNNRHKPDAGQLARRILLFAARIFHTLFRWRPSLANEGARDAITHVKFARPTESNPPIFECELWPACGCPGGTMRPECPGLYRESNKT